MIRGSLTVDGGSLLFLYMVGVGVACASAMVIHGVSRVSPIAFASSGLTAIAAELGRGDRSDKAKVSDGDTKLGDAHPMLCDVHPKP